MTVTALLLLVLGAGLLVPEWTLAVSFVGLFSVIIGFALLTPLITLGLMRLFQRTVGDAAGVIERMAPRTVIRALSRTSVAVAALMVAVSVIIGVGIMIGSFRNTVEVWLEELLQADLFISAPSLGSNLIPNALDPELVPQIAEFPGIARVVTSRSIDTVAFPESRAGDAVAVRLVAISSDLAGEKRRYQQSHRGLADHVGRGDGGCDPDQ